MNKIFKRIVAIISLSAFVLTSTGCVSLNINSDSEKNTIKGNGEVITKEYEVDDFDSISVNSSFVLVLDEGNSNTVKLKVKEDFLKHIKINTEGSQLVVDAPKRFAGSVENNDLPVVTVSKDNISKIKLLESAQLYTFKDKNIKMDNLSVEASGDINMKINMTITNLNIVSSGSTNIFLSGNFSNLDISNSGFINILSSQMESKNVKIDFSGAGNAFVNVSETLMVDISGAGTVQYTGEANVIENISGAGIVQKTNDGEYNEDLMDDAFEKSLDEIFE